MKKLPILIFFISNLLLMTACQQEANFQETPINTASRLLSILSLEKSQPQTGEYAYESFVDLFMEDFNNNATKEKFQALKNVHGSSTGASLTNCVSITLENGAMLLVYLYKESDSDQYEVYDIVVVPEEMRSLIQELGL